MVSPVEIWMSCTDMANVGEKKLVCVDTRDSVVVLLLFRENAAASSKMVGDSTLKE